MRNTERTPEIFSDPSETTLDRDEKWMPVNVPTSPDGGYRGNGEFRNAEGKTFKILTGFDKTGKKEVWFHRGYIKVPKHPYG